ncbi:hypothetical protein SY83_22365 [Paenibacillus swuensis]|uniref:Sporulation protein n=1 Tax=Paenibacillus swuensis TaxID=1178515 RepID=A0A172TNE3_9BACL|nr:putative sporulation protein YtxC [Paenibacillus swuensis]ANE48575.1 hypothetical protein SY83_22365 [Paenibacillus swuensis]
MELFTLWMAKGSETQVDKLFGELMEELRELHIDSLKVFIDTETEQELVGLRCTWYETDTELANKVRERAGRGIASYVLAEYEERIIKKMIINEYAYKIRDEISKIETYTLHILDQSEEEIGGHQARKRRKNQIALAFITYLEEFPEVNIDGFIHFRLHAYAEELREVVEYAIDEYLMDKQYQEFIALLKYFVYIQDAKIPVAHLMHKGENDFILLNEDFEPIETKQVETFVVEMIDKDINYEDMIVSTLITVSPQKVFIHTREPEMQVIKTIKQIFDDRATLCTLCGSCSPHLGDFRKEQRSTLT